MDTVKSQYKDAAGYVSVTVHQSNLTNNGKNFLRVSRNTVTLENLIASIIKGNHGVDPYNIQHSAILIQQEIIKMLRLGKAVNVLDLGSMYLAVDGSVKGDNLKESDIPDLTVKFTPSSFVKDSVKGVVVDVIVKSQVKPTLTKITDGYTKAENQFLIKKGICFIKGEHLKLGGVENPVSFVMVDDNGNEIKNQALVYLDESRIFANTPSKLSFFVPDELIAGKKYKIRVSSRYIQKDKFRKTAITGESIALEIKASE